jgi:hypothetical protein
MRITPRHRLAVALAALGMVLAAPRPSQAGCAVVEKTNTNLPVPTKDVRVVGDTLPQMAVIEIHSDGSYVVKIDCNYKGGLPDFTDSTLDKVVPGPGPAEGFSLELGGRDTVQILQFDDFSGVSRSVTVALTGTGNTVTYSSQGHAMTSRSNVSLEIVGSSLVDNVLVDLAGSALDTSMFILRGDMGFGADKLEIRSPATMNAAELDLGMDMGPGYNTFVWNDAGTVTASTVALELQGGDEPYVYDTATLNASGTLEGNSRAEVRFHMNNGSDVVKANFDLANFGVDTLGASGSEARYWVLGGAAWDNISVNGTGLGSAVNNGLIDIRTEGDDQGDVLTLDWPSLAGSGTFRYRSGGGSAYDLVIASLATDAASTNVLDMWISGGAERDISFTGDTAVLAVVNQGAAVTGPMGAVIVSGGTEEIDFCSFFGNVPHFAYDCEAGAF